MLPIHDDAGTGDPHRTGHFFHEEFIFRHGRPPPYQRDDERRGIRTAREKNMIDDGADAAT